MKRLLLALAAVALLVSPAYAGGGLFRSRSVQRIVVRQQVQRVVVQQQVAQVVAVPVVQQVVVPQFYAPAQIVAPVVQRQCFGNGCAAFFAK